MEKSTDVNQVVVSESGKSHFSQQIVVGHHVLTADEPLANGGNDLGPSPYDFLLTALGTCTSMTLRMYADLKKLPLTKVVVRLSHEKIHANDCVECEKSDVKIDHIQRVIELEGDLTVEQRTKLVEIANKCPVHRTLTSNIHIITQLTE